MAEKRVIHAEWGAGQLACDGKDHWFLHPEEQQKAGHPAETHAGVCTNPRACQALAAEAEKAKSSNG